MRAQKSVVVVVVTLGAALVSPLLPACHFAQAVDEDAVAALKAAKPGSHLTGAPTGLGDPVVVNRRDFVYAVNFDAGSNDLAFVHHVSTHMELTATGIEPLAPHFQEKVNPNEFDCEDVVYVGDRIVVPSRQGTLRAFDRKTGKLMLEVATGEGLLRAALSPDGKLLAVSSTEGRVMIFDSTSLALLGEGQPHKDEVRGLVFRGDLVVSASEDQTLVVSSLAPAESAVVRVPTTALKTGERVFLAHLDGAHAIATIRDNRQTTTVISRDAVKRLGLVSRTDGMTLAVGTAEGAKDYPAIDIGTLSLRLLEVGPIVAAVCDECLPPGSELLLGQDVLARVSLSEDVARDELIAKPPETPEAHTVAHLVAGARMLSTVKTIALPGPGTDLDISAGGAVVVAFSKDKAERTFEINDAERKGKFPPPSPQSGAAFVDVDAGVLGKSFVNGHLGFTVTAAVSPDGRSVVTGGWDRRVLVWDAVTGEQVTERSVSWLVRRVRFARDGHLVAVAAWTPVNALNEGNSDPSLLLYPVALDHPTIASAP